MDLLPEICVAPQYRPSMEELLPAAMRKEMNAFLATGQPHNYPTILRQQVTLQPHEHMLYGTKYNVVLLNASVFYIGVWVRPCAEAPAPFGAHNFSSTSL